MNLYEIRNVLNNGKTIFELVMSVTFYARVSTDKYEQANSLKNQVDYFREIIKNNPNWTYVEGYVDEGISGTSVNKRDSFLKMIKDAKQGKFDFIITKEISRFSRSTLDSITYTQELLKHGVGVLFQSDNINTLYPDSELRLTLMSSIAQEEVRKISERVKFGFRRSIEGGRVLGNNAIWGYKKEDGKLVIDEEEAEIIRCIFELYAIDRLGIRTVSKELESRGFRTKNGTAFSFSTIRNIISNPKYKGYYCGNKSRIVDYRLKQKVSIKEEDWVMYKDEEAVPAIVSEEIWEAANRILQGRGEKAKTNESAYQSRYAYSGKIFCAEHNVSFHRTTYKYPSGNKELWQCKMYREKGKSGCYTPSIYTTELDAVVRDAFDEFIIKKADIIHRMISRYNSALQDNAASDEIKKKQTAISKIIMKKDKILDLNIDGKISNDEFANRNNSFNEEIETLKADITILENEQKEMERVKSSIKSLSDIITEKINLDNNSESNEIINTVLEKIVVNKTEDKNRISLKIYFKFDQECNAELERVSKGRTTHHFVSDDMYRRGRGF